MSNEQDTAQELAEKLYDDMDEGVLDVTVDELEAKFEQYIEYDVHPDSARSTIVRNLASEAGVEISEAMGGSTGSGGGSELVKIEDIDEPEVFVTVEVTVHDLWDDNDTDSISQVGIVNDDTGRIKFVSWEKSEVPILVEGQSYKLTSVATNEYKGRMSISLNSSTEVEMIDEEFEAPDNTKEFTGSFVHIHDGSGLIRRCPNDDCNRVLSGGECTEHGDVDGVFDLRVRGVLDNGTDTQNVNFGCEITEALTGINLEEAKSMAQEALDTDVVGVEIAKVLLGNYFTVGGWVNDRDTLMVTEADESTEVGEYSISELITKVDALEETTVDDESEAEEVTN
jgi:replication factor A1